MNHSLVVSSYISDGQGVLESNVDVDYDPARYAMAETDETRDMINRIWRERTKNNPRLFNQSKYRLASEYISGDGRVQLHVGITDYKDHVGTNLSDQVQRYLGEGEEKFNMMSQCIGVGGWVVTTDNKVIMVETAGWKGEGACSVDRPGGHAEPEESLKHVITETGVESSYSDITNTLVTRELFESIQKEIRDELNISLVHQAAPELLGVVYNMNHGGRLTMDFLVMLDIDSKEVLTMYQDGGVEADESTALFFIDKEDIPNHEQDMDKKLRERFTPHSIGSIELLKIRLANIR